MSVEQVVAEAARPKLLDAGDEHSHLEFSARLKVVQAF
jgi:hypothetical protein